MKLPLTLGRSTALLLATALSSAACADEILVKGAWASANDTVTPLPEKGTVARNVYDNRYFGLKYAFTAGWSQQLQGPPPSDSGFYVLAQIEPADRGRRSSEGHALIAAQDMFFGAVLAASTIELINQSKEHLDAEFIIEQQPGPMRIAHRDFVRFGYRSPVSQLHWQILATQIRCHTVEFIFTGRDATRMQKMVKALDALQMDAEDSPVCIKDFASTENLIAREDAVLPDTRFNPIPVRIIIGTDGRIEHIHFISAFPEQIRGISDALHQWRFKPYRVDGRPVRVETGIMFGRASPTPAQSVR